MQDARCSNFSKSTAQLIEGVVNPLLDAIHIHHIFSLRLDILAVDFQSSKYNSVSLYEYRRDGHNFARLPFGPTRSIPSSPLHQISHAVLLANARCDHQQMQKEQRWPVSLA